MIASEPPSTVWCSYQGGLLKCSPEQLRPWTDAEQQAWEEVPDEIRQDLPKDNRGRRKYEDLTTQGEIP